MMATKQPGYNASSAPRDPDATLTHPGLREDLSETRRQRKQPDSNTQRKNTDNEDTKAQPLQPARKETRLTGTQAFQAPRRTGKAQEQYRQRSPGAPIPKEQAAPDRRVTPCRRTMQLQPFPLERRHDRRDPKVYKMTPPPRDRRVTSDRRMTQQPIALERRGPRDPRVYKVTPTRERSAPSDCEDHKSHNT